jgi:hypothetical protein
MDVLEKQMQEPCGDAISRQAVLDLAKKGILVSNGNYKSVCKAIYELPSVNPQEKTGHWISFGVQGEVDGQIVQVFTCSECGAISIFRMTSGNIVNGDICPNCKANMRKESEDKDSEVSSEKDSN